MDDIWRWIGVALLGVLWLKVTGYNVFFAADRINRRSRQGPPGLRVFGSLCGIAVLILAPVGSLPARFLLIPVALIPDMAIPLAKRIVNRRDGQGD